ncbi:MAG: signal peptidase I [Planctomycetota bacterium]
MSAPATSSATAPATSSAPRHGTVWRRRSPPGRPVRGHFRRDVLRGVALLVLLHLFVVQISVVRGHSMQPCLSDGDRLVVDRLAYCVAAVARFDVVVLRYPADPTVDFVKRVVGLPGDRVELHHGVVFVNGRRVEEAFGPVRDGAEMDERRIPDGHYFVLGDNRPISCDSREFGLVPFELIKGKVRVRFWPVGRMAVF